MTTESTLEMMDLKTQVMDLVDITERQENEINRLISQNEQMKKMIRFLVQDSEFIKESNRLKTEGLSQKEIAKAMGFIRLGEYRRRLCNALDHQREEHASV